MSIQSAGDLTLVALFRSCTGEEVKQDAAGKFADRYMEKLVSLIQRNISGRFQSRFDAEDVAQSVMRSWFEGVRKRKIHPTSSSEIWPLISVMALNKVRNRIRFNQAGRRDVRQSEAGDEISDQIPEPTPDDVVAFEDMLQVISDSLDEQSREVLQLILEGYSVTEISERLEVSTKTIQRRKKTIREQILKHLPDDLRAIAESFADDREDS